MIVVFSCSQMTMTIWVESIHSDNKEYNLVKDTPCDGLKSKFVIVRVARGDTKNCFQLFPNDHDHLGGVQPL